MKELLVFEIKHSKEDEEVWVAAYTNIHALSLYFSTCNMDMMDMEDEDEITQLPEEKWKEMVVTNTDHNHEEGEWEKMTFEQYVKENGAGVIAGTAFDD